MSRDGGRSFAEANEWRQCVSREDAGREAARAALGSLVMCGADLGARAKRRARVERRRGGATWARVNGAPSRVDAIAIDAVTGELVALARRPARGACIARGERGRRLGRSPVTPCVPAGSRRGAGGARRARSPWPLARRGAFRDGRRFREDGRASKGRRRSRRSPTARRERSSSRCAPKGRGARGSSKRGPPTARRGSWPSWGTRPTGTHEDESDARVRALAWDGSRGVMWAAGAFGLVALRPARR